MSIFAHKGVVHDNAGESVAHILSDTSLILVTLVIAVAVIAVIALKSGRFSKARVNIKDKETNHHD